MRLKISNVNIFLAVLAISFGSNALAQTQLTDAGKKLEAKYAKQLSDLGTELTAKLPSKKDQTNSEKLESFLASDTLDASLSRYVILKKSTPRGLALFAQQSSENEALIDKLLAYPKLMVEMLVADGAKAPRVGRGEGPPNYGRAIKIYSDIRKASPNASSGVFQRLALAVSLEHAVPVAQTNPVGDADAPKYVDPVKRYLHFEKAFIDGELDPAFENLSTWNLRMVVDGDEPDETLAWGRKMLRNHRPDHIFSSNHGWRYVSIVGSDVKYGSGDVKHDRPELQKYQNILMNGGVCGRRAFFGRFILRSFGIPTTARPSRGHAALAHWTPDGWVINLGPGWGKGWTKTRYNQDVNFLATSQARKNPTAFMKVKRARWAGDVLGEGRWYNESEIDKAEFWNALALKTQRTIIKDLKAVALAPLGEDLGESNEPTVAEKILASPVTPADKKITYGDNGTISIPAAGFTKPARNTRDVIAMKSFNGGLQVFLPRFFPSGKTILRGGTWKSDPSECTSGTRLLSDGYGKYENWGLRVAISANGAAPKKELKLKLSDGVSMEFVYIPAGSFVMGGKNNKDGRFKCVELPKHGVTITRGFYLGKYEVTQAQYQTTMKSNPSRSTKDPNCPVDNIGIEQANAFCIKLAELSGRDTRLPTEAEWEYASRGGNESEWFFGDDAAALNDYAWFGGNSQKKSHPVGQKQPNPFGLYDIYGNVCERVSDTYSKSYYSKSPTEDPTGPSQGSSSHVEYKLNAPKAGQYSLNVSVVTANYDQRLNASVNDSQDATVIELPFTEGDWRETGSVMLTLVEGENTLRLWRDTPPQYGVSLKTITLKPAK